MNALLVICGLGIFALVAEIINFKKWLPAFVMLGLVAAGITLTFDYGTSVMHFSEMLLFDNFSHAFTGLIVVTALFWFWMAQDYFRLQPQITDRSALILFTIAGAIIMASFNNMAMLFLGLEILSISLYVLAGSRKESLYSRRRLSNTSSGDHSLPDFSSWESRLFYGAKGSFHLNDIEAFITSHEGQLPTFFMPGYCLLIALVFKISAVPFHFWAPDVYEGSPTT